MRFVDLQEGTPAWVEWRRGGLGSADAPPVAGLSRWKNARRVWEIKTGRRPYSLRAESSRGRMVEPLVRARYEAMVGAEAPPRCCEHGTIPWLRASLDGWVAERALPVEIKAPERGDHETALDGLVPAPYLPQCLHILLVTGAPRMHYVSWHDRFAPPLDLAVVEVTADAALLAELLSIEEAFWKTIPGLMPPGTKRWKVEREAVRRACRRAVIEPPR